jgi:Caspase domain
LQETEVRFSHITAVGFVLLCAIATGHAENRVALVIGNDRYANLSDHEQLRKAVNDARAVGGALKQIGFDVISGENLGRQAMIDKLGETAQRLSAGDMVFFFFAGHGIAVDGANYILPADVPDVDKNQATRLKGAAIAEEYMATELIGAGAQVAVVVLDACRENPFGSGTRGIGGERGLQPREPPSGVFTIYSASRGQAALDRLSDDDRNPNSVFTRVLVPALTRPGVDLGALAIGVREDVARIAKHAGYEQRPAYYDETIGGQVYLTGLPPGKPGGGGDRSMPPAGPAADEVAWGLVKETMDDERLRTFIAQYPDSPRRREAEERLKQAALTRYNAALKHHNDAAPQETPAVQKTLGLSLANMTAELRKRYKIKDGVKGIVITDVDAQSQAAEKRLSAGEVVIEVVQEQVNDTNALQIQVDRLRKEGKPSAVLLVAAADGTMRFVALGLR